MRASNGCITIHSVSQTALIIEDSQICGTFRSDKVCCSQRSQLHNFEGNLCQPIGRQFILNVVLGVWRYRQSEDWPPISSGLHIFYVDYIKLGGNDSCAKTHCFKKLSNNLYVFLVLNHFSENYDLISSAKPEHFF